MRLPLLAALGLVILTAPAMAQSRGVVGGNYTCSQKVPCVDSSEYASSDWANAGNACMKQGFGRSTPEGFFDEYAGLNSSRCLTLKPNTENPLKNATPYCCVKDLPNNTCVISCVLYYN